MATCELRYPGTTRVLCLLEICCISGSQTNLHVRFNLSLSLNQKDVRGVTQWQRLAAAMISTLIGTEFEEKYHFYIEKCNHPDELRKFIIQTQGKEQLCQFFDELVEAIIENQPDLDFNFLKAVLFLILKFPQLAQIGMAWIQGTEHNNIREAGLPEFSAQEQDAKSIWFIQQICKLASVVSRPVLICFDQLDSANVSNDCGDSPIEIVASCWQGDNLT